MTTVVDAGSAGAATFDGIARQLGDLRLVEGLALVNLSRIGRVGEFDELAHPSLIDVEPRPRPSPPIVTSSWG